MNPVFRASPNHDNRPDGDAIDMLVLHYTGMQTADAALKRLCDPVAKVSAHYLIDEDGSCIHLVEDAQRAWHAGVSGWQGRSGLNDVSIGIELVNPGHEWGYRPFPQAQMTSLFKLVEQLLKHHAIPLNRVLGHSDIAPARKEDPGELFEWQALADRGLAIMPARSDTDDGTGAELSDWHGAGTPPRNEHGRKLSPQDENHVGVETSNDEAAVPPLVTSAMHVEAGERLRAIGYDFSIATAEQILRAFQRRFAPKHLGDQLSSPLLQRIRCCQHAMSKRTRFEGDDLSGPG